MPFVTRTGIPPLIRTGVGRVLGTGMAQRLLRPWNRNRAVIFLLHRVTDSGGQDQELLRACLAFLQRHRIPVMEVRELLCWAQDPSRPSGPRVAFTLDDGYLDQARVAAPIFHEFGFPATIYVITDFLDQGGWMWWDRLRVTLARTERDHLTLELGPGGIMELDLGDPQTRDRSIQRLEATLKAFPAQIRDEALARLEAEAGVSIPPCPPREDGPMSWDDARQCEELGVTIGAHTRSHPILARESDERARREIQESWERVRTEVRDPCPVFCYPNGLRGDFGHREMAFARDAGMEGAVAAEGGYLDGCAPQGHRTPSDNVPDELAAFALPRIHLPSDLPAFIRIISGLDTQGRRSVPCAPATSRNRPAASLDAPAQRPC